jgi:nucleotide-binding universal stress UspA family protein
MITNILVAYDGSNSAVHGLTLGVDFARAFGASLHLLAVVQPPEFGGTVETEAVVEQSRRQRQKVLHDLQTKYAQDSVKMHVHIAVGHPAEQIVRFAESNNIDHIIVGHRGHTLFDRWLIGSVARHVIAFAPCAVTVAR